jgi:hypothetical protein
VTKHSVDRGSHNDEDSSHGLHPEDGGSMGFRNADILPHHYMLSQGKRPRFKRDLVLTFLVSSYEAREN